MDDINIKFDINLVSEDATTLSGLIVESIGHKLENGAKVKLGNNVTAEITEVNGIRVGKVILTIAKLNADTKD